MSLCLSPRYHDSLYRNKSFLLLLLKYSPNAATMSWAQCCDINILCFPYDMYITETDSRDERFDVKQNNKLNKIYNKSPDKYLKGQQVIMEIHTPSSQKNAARRTQPRITSKNVLASCLLALLPALTRTKVTVFCYNNSEERGTFSHLPIWH